MTYYPRNHRYTYICFDCQTVLRHSGKCNLCGFEMIDIGHKIEVPKKTNKNKWKQFKKLLIKRGY